MTRDAAEAAVATYNKKLLGSRQLSVEFYDKTIQTTKDKKPLKSSVLVDFVVMQVK